MCFDALLTNQDASEGNDERKSVSAKRLVIFAIALAEEVQVREESITTQCL